VGTTRCIAHVSSTLGLYSVVEHTLYDTRCVKWALHMCCTCYTLVFYVWSWLHTRCVGTTSALHKQLTWYTCVLLYTYTVRTVQDNFNHTVWEQLLWHCLGTTSMTLSGNNALHRTRQLYTCVIQCCRAHILRHTFCQHLVQSGDTPCVNTNETHLLSTPMRHTFCQHLVQLIASHTRQRFSK